MTTIPAVAPPSAPAVDLNRRLKPGVAFGWLAAGWRDFIASPLQSLAYGFIVFVISLAIIGGLFAFGLDYILFPALAGFMVVGPVLAVGLYEKSRRLAAGESISLARMIFVKPASAGQILFAGVLLCLLMLLWMRSAVIIYALFFGLRPFPGLDHVAPMLFATPIGWAMLVVGGAVGGLFDPDAAEPSRRFFHRHGNQHGARLEQPSGDVDLGRDRAGAVSGERRHGIDRPHRRVPRSRTWGVACLSRDRATRGIAPVAAGGRYELLRDRPCGRGYEG